MGHFGALEMTFKIDSTKFLTKKSSVYNIREIENALKNIVDRVICEQR